ncbi:MAG: T9SS type A sorting domain-containing protein [Candidatus Kapaibacterium sp.]
MNKNEISMRSVFILIISIFIYSEDFAQSGWVLQNSETKTNLLGISTFDGINAVAVGEKGTVTTTNNEGRPSWRLQKSPIGSTFNGVTSLSSSILLAVGPADSVYRSRDHGATWIGIHSFAKGQCWTLPSINQLSSVDFDSVSKVCVAVGDQNEAIFSDDSGKHWEERLPFMLPGWSLSDFKCVSSSEGIVISAGTSLPISGLSEVFTSIDQGDSWMDVPTGTPGVGTPERPTFSGCDSKAWIVVGTGGTIVKSIDQGYSWVPILSGTTVNLNAVRFAPDSLDGFIAGDGGMILMTRDGGYTWTQEFPPTKKNLRSVALADPFHVYICGDSGTILWTQDGGFSGVRSPSGEVAMDIQTFPNPLSTKTTIQIFLRQSRHVKLRVFNMLGVEIANIASDIYDQGPHSFEWNASEVPNGMYICRLESEGQSIISQMIVAK